jgi:hypothetical protein
VLRASMDVCHFRGLYTALPRGGVIVILLSVANAAEMPSAIESTLRRCYSTALPKGRLSVVALPHAESWIRR